MIDPKPYVITFCSGKSGVGKSIIASNVAHDLSKNGVHTLLCDSNPYSPTLHLLFGVEPFFHAQDLTDNKQSIDKIAYPLQDKLQLIARSTSLFPDQSESDFRRSLEMIITTIDSECIIFDSNSGASSEVLACCRVSDIIVVVLTDEPSSVIDGYGLIKIIQSSIPNSHICLVINNVIDIEDAEDTTHKLNQATHHFLSTEFDSLGFIPYDRAVKSSIIQQKLLSKYYPDSGASLAIQKLSVSIGKLIYTKTHVQLATVIC